MWRCWSPFSWPLPFDGLLVMALGLALVVALFAWLAARPGTGSAGHRRGARADKEDALRLLARRLDDGAIDQDTYERLRRAIEP